MQRRRYMQDSWPGRSFCGHGRKKDSSHIILLSREDKTNPEKYHNAAINIQLCGRFCLSLLWWPAGAELRNRIWSCQRTSANTQRQMQRASSFTINTCNPSRNKLSQLFFEDSAKHWRSTEVKMNSASLKQAIFDVCVCFCCWLKVTEK